VSKRIAILCRLLLLALIHTGAGAEDTGWTVPPGLVSAAVIQAKIDEAEADPALDGEDKAKLVALYRKALTNLEQIDRNRARAVGFEEGARTAPEQTRQIRERIAQAKVAAVAAQAGGPPELGIARDAPLHDIERELMLAQAERDAAVARRDALERRLPYQENRLALIRERLGAADEEQRTIASALQTELAGDTGAALSQARRWDLETRYIALSAEMMALDQELASLPMRLELLRAQRDQELVNTGQIERRVEALQVLLNDRRKDEARQVKADTERWLQASAGQDPALIRLAAQNVVLAAAFAALFADSDRLDAEQQQAERLAARTRANFERVKTAKAVDVSSEGLGQLLLEHRAALPDFETYARRVSVLEQQIGAVSLSRLRHLEEAERLAAEPTTPSQAVGGPPADDALLDLLAQRRGLLERQLEAEAQHLERLRRLRASQAQMLEAARAYDDFLSKQLFWLPTGAATRLAALANLPQEARLLFSADRRSELARLLAGEVIASPVLWLVLLLAAALLWKRRALIAAIQGTAVPLKHPDTDRFGHTLRALLLTLALAAPLPLVLGVTGWQLLAASQATELSLLLGAALLRIVAILFVLLALWRICLPGGLAIAHFRWPEPEVRRLAVRAAREQRAALAVQGAGALPAAQTEEPTLSQEADLDLDAASEDSLRLLHGAVGLAAAIALYLIWSTVFPALGIFDEVTLWHTMTTIDGEERRLPISLADLGLAVIYLGVALMLARRLPALLDMILAQRLEVASGSRYTITRLSAYIIVATGILLALNTIGAQWTQLQWLVAALGVGIGFGLQEIVANFISGLIILFERPIRVGDIVTVGDTDGTVTKIRIRATTIRNWDRKELLVPNKEFITGRLLNWSLSDQVTRVMVTVGVAYGTDVEKAHALMQEAAAEHERVLQDPAPVLTFEAFGDNSLTLTLRAFIDDLDYRLATITDLHKAINRKFEQAGINIAFPQRDLHLDAREPLRIAIESMRPNAPAGGPAGAPSEPPHAGLSPST
jgi:small-conductance mechanosensitive channel